MLLITYSVWVINKPCVCSRTMRLSTFCGLRRDQEQLLSNFAAIHPYCYPPQLLSIRLLSSLSSLSSIYLVIIPPDYPL